MRYTIRRLLITPLLTLAVAGAYTYGYLTLIMLGATPSATLKETFFNGLFLGLGASIALLIAPRKANK